MPTSVMRVFALSETRVMISVSASIMSDIAASNTSSVGDFTADKAAAILAKPFDRREIASVGLNYERLDQLTMDILFGVDG